MHAENVLSLPLDDGTAVINTLCHCKGVFHNFVHFFSVSHRDPRVDLPTVGRSPTRRRLGA